MKELIELSKFALSLGISGALLVALILIVQEPSRAEKLKALILGPTFRLFRWGSKQYLAAKVGGTVTGFLRHYIGTSLLSIVTPKVQIRWVSSAVDPILSEEGTLILCLEDSNDQTRNILLATRVALPHFICPTARANIGKHVQTAVDLAVLQKLADGLGQHARPLFQRYFLKPEVDAEQRVADLFSKLVELDSKGIFVFIFLEELNSFGERLYRSGNLLDKTPDVENLLEFLLTLARRQLGEDIELDYISKEFKISVILVAKTSKAQNQGVVPYLKAVDFRIAKGCDSIYLIGFIPSAKTFNRVLDALDADQRVAIEKRNRVRITPDMQSNFSEYIDIGLARVIRYMGDASFEERVQAAGIDVDMLADGIVLDVVEDACVVDVRGMRCTLRRADCSWNYVANCADIVNLHDKISVVVKKIDLDVGAIEVSRRLPAEDPWKQVTPPEPGDVVEVTFTRRAGNHFLALYRTLIEISIPVEEMSWLGADAVKEEEFVGATEKVSVLRKDDSQHSVMASVRLMEENPWPQIHKRYPKNTELRGIVCDVNPQYVVVTLQDGLVGHIPRESLLKAGFEFADYERSVVVGQGLDVVVSKVFLEKKRIRLDLKRNAATLAK